MNDPRFSVVTISYNQSNFLKRAIESVIGQPPELLEYIVMDGGSTDGSKEVIESYSERLAFWQSCHDGGPSAALRNAVERCAGQYLVYINSDDLLLPGALRAMDSWIEATDEPDVLYGHGVLSDLKTSKTYRAFSDRWDTTAYAKGLVSVFQQSCALKLASVREAGNFNFGEHDVLGRRIAFRVGAVELPIRTCK